MKLAMVVPVLNEAATLALKLQALAPLRARGAELIVVDGGSTDGTLAIAQALADRVLQAPRGRASQLNAGAAATRAEVLLTLDEVAVWPATHPLARQRKLQLEDFAGEYFVSLSADDPYRRLIDARFAEAGVARTLRMETHSAAAVCAMVQQGLGVAIVNPVTALAAASDQLVMRPLAFSIPFSVSALLPLYRPPLPEVAPMLEALRAEAAAIAQRLAQQDE